MRVPFRAGVVVAIALAAVAYASAQSGTPAANAIAARQQLMKDQGAAMRSISQKGKAGQIMEIATDAEILARTANQIPGLFPPGSVDPEKSRAKPEIWQKWSEFERTRQGAEHEGHAARGDGQDRRRRDDDGRGRRPRSHHLWLLSRGVQGTRDQEVAHLASRAFFSAA